MLCGLALLLAAALAGAQTLGLGSEPRDLARAALGGLRGSAVVGIWHDGKASYAGVRDGEVLGEAALAGDQAALFGIGSISKVFTGLLLAQAVERGELTLDDTLAALLAGKVSFASDKVGAGTLRQLVTHTSCLPRMPSDFAGASRTGDSYARYDRARLWAALAALKLETAPPCEALYSNLGVALLGELLSEHYAKPWQVLVHERITEPLGMHDTVQALGDKAARLVPGFAGTTPIPPWDMQAFAGAGSLRSSASDMLLFGRAILAGRNGPLGPAAERLVTPLARFDGGIGYALWLRGPAERRTYAHDGRIGAYLAQLVLAADTGEVMIMLVSNADAPLARVTADVLALRYPVVPGSASVDAEKLAEYAGVYRIGKRTALSFVVQDGVLYTRYTGQPFVALAASEPDVFTLAARGRIVFERDGGRIVGLTMSSRGSELHALRTAEPLPPRATLPEAQLHDFVGRYQGGALSFDVQANAGVLMVKLGSQPRFPVFPVADKPDRFAYDVVQAELQFERYASGEVRALVLHQNGEQRAARVE